MSEPESNPLCPAAQPAPTTRLAGFDADPSPPVDKYPPQSSGYPSRPIVYQPMTQATGYPPQPNYPSKHPAKYNKRIGSLGRYGCWLLLTLAISSGFIGLWLWCMAPSAQTTYYPTQNSGAIQKSLVNEPAHAASYSTQGFRAIQKSFVNKPVHAVSHPTQGSGAIQKLFVNKPAHVASHPTQSSEQRTPTVKPVSPFNPQNDAAILKKAMNWGTDEDAIINVLTKRSNQQRLEIAAAYQIEYDKDLAKKLEGEVSGKLEDLILALMKPLPEFLADELYDAMKHWGTKESTLVEILCSASNAEIHNITAAYDRLHPRHTLQNKLIGDTSGIFQELLISLVQGRRSENNSIDEAAAIRDAQTLMSAGTDKSAFATILSSRSYPQLRRVMEEYKRISSVSLEHTINSKFEDDIKMGLIAIIKLAENEVGFFAKRLHDAIHKKTHKQLIRVVVSRCEIDLQNIKEAYLRSYEKTLVQDITKHVRGDDYKKALLSLVSGF